MNRYITSGELCATTFEPRASGSPLQRQNHAAIPCQLNQDIKEREPVPAKLPPYECNILGLAVHDLKVLTHFILRGARNEAIDHLYRHIAEEVATPPAL